ncbi:MAG: hypothetical protein PHD73_04615 [Sediminibacterium sp.]|nr:hypothetical protein [Sediminibacterium sp.]
MKKIILWMLIGTVAVSASAQDQPPAPKPTPMHQPAPRVNAEALKVAFITRQLNLSVDEAQKFWPIHNSYMEELKKARVENKENELAFEEKALAIRKKYNADFKKILNSDERANRVLKLEKDFNNMMRKELVERMKKNPAFQKRMENNPQFKKRMEEQRAPKN